MSSDMSAAAKKERGETEDDLKHKVGQGNWRAMAVVDYPVEKIFEAAKSWAAAVQGIEKPWLVWCAHPDWAIVQQRIVESVGWTPIVGYDPRVSDVPLIDGAVRVDFNDELKLPLMYPHFPVEFAYLWVDKLAFWHSDLLLREHVAQDLAAKFDALEPGECFVTRFETSLRSLFFKPDKRYWELVACTTRGASQDQWDKGAGWWMNFHLHPNCPSEEEREQRQSEFYDHGTGVWYWDKKLGGKIKSVSAKTVGEGHFSKMRPQFVRSIPKDQPQTMRSMEKDLNNNESVAVAARSLGLDRFLD